MVEIGIHKGVWQNYYKLKTDVRKEEKPSTKTCSTFNTDTSNFKGYYYNVVNALNELEL